MTFPSGAINDSAPPDSADTSAGAGDIRLTREYILDRLNSFFVDADTNPLTPQAGVILAGMIADATITAAQIALATITGAQIADNTITELQMAPLSIGTPELILQSVTTGILALLSVTDAQINDVSGSKIDTGTIPGTALENQAVTATQIANGTITAAQIANAVITAAQIALLTITGAQMANGTVTATQLDPTTVLDIIPLTKTVNYVIAVPISVFTRSVVTSAGNAFVGLVPGDVLQIGLPDVWGSITDGSQRGLVFFTAIADTDQFWFRISNPNDGPLVVPAGTWVVSCTKETGSW